MNPTPPGHGGSPGGVPNAAPPWPQPPVWPPPGVTPPAGQYGAAPRPGDTLPSGRRFGKLRELAAKYGRMLWWTHSLYALALGVSVVIFAQKGFAHARFLTISLAVAWIGVIVFFRLFGSGAQQQVEGRAAKMRFFVMTYVLKNMYQGMLFFLLPFYWRSITFGTENQWFLFGLGICAFLSTMDVVFDRMLMKWKWAASTFYFFTLFACLNLVIPAIAPNQRSALTLCIAAVLAALAFWTMHVPFKMLKKPLGVTLLLGWSVASLMLAYVGREAVPPVAMYLAKGAVGPKLLPDGRLAIEASALHGSLVNELYAVTDVMSPGGRGDRLVHRWMKDGELVQESTDVNPTENGDGIVRLQSKLDDAKLSDPKTGHWSVDVFTEDGQLVGRAPFDVIE
ncbi:MAG TPA: DUF5924 family protein [Nannocystaceae bacterium]|nr:DUF5924 family protein [Nannocystaceae bacterium]